jgi:hypothetical protein
MPLLEKIQELGNRVLQTVVGAPLAAMKKAGSDLIGGIQTGLTTGMTRLGGWLTGLPARILGAVPGMLTTLNGKGLELILGFAVGASQAWDQFKVFLGTIGSLARTAIGDLWGALTVKGMELIGGLKLAAQEAWTTVTAWLSTVGALASEATGSLFEALYSRGSELITGLWDGADVVWGDVWSWLTGLGSEAAGAVGDMSSALYNAGYSLISGLASGITDAGQVAINAATAIRDAVADILSNIPGMSPLDHAGFEMGSTLISHYAKGMQAQQKAVALAASGARQAAVAGLTGSIGPTVSVGGASRAGARSGGGPVVNISMAGAIVGKGAAAEIMSMIGGDVTRLVDNRTRSMRYAEARS